ncbi:MAG: hypothetical protein WCI48_00760 [Bacteroidota bacterium]|jgi:EthD domain
MQKIVIIFRANDEFSYSEFIDYMLRMAGHTAETCSPYRLHITFSDAVPPVLSVIPFKKSKIGLMSVYFKDSFSSAEIKSVLEKSLKEISNPAIRLAGSYVVEEALPVSYHKTWEDAVITPGVCLLTLFRRKPGISHETFLDFWHNSHTPLSLEIHPLWHYNRNVILGQLEQGSEAWEGIVEEHFRKRSDLLNPLKFFGNPFSMIPNMIRVYKDTNAFLDYKTIETYLVREVIVKS